MNIIMAQLNFTIGDFELNYSKIKDTIEKNDNAVIVFSELCITGYPPLDLIERNGFIEDQLFYLNKIVQLTSNKHIAVIVGFIEKNNSGIGKPFFNSMAFCHDGEIKYVYRKRLLPTYGIFDESRHFEPGNDVGFYIYEDISFGLLTCEDCWNDKSIAQGKYLYKINPVKETVDLNPDIIISINASPSNVGKPEYRLEKFTKMMNEYDIPFIYVNQIGGHDDIIFDGSSFAIDSGELVYVCDSFKEELKQLEIIEYDGRIMLAYVNNEEKKGDNLYSLKTNKSDFYYNQIILGIKDYVKKNGFKKAVIASSGGVDSALVMTLAVDALGKENVEAITMPSAISSLGSVSDSKILCDNLGIKLYNFPIKNSFDVLVDQFNNSIDAIKRSITKENLQARLRGTILMAFTNDNPQFIPLTTGNKSECAVGYCTLYGDMSGGLAPISDLYKTEVWELCKFINKLHEKEIIPNVIIDKEPSAELYEGQKDSDSLPKYSVLDAILIPYIEGNEIDNKILDECKEKTKHLKGNEIERIHRMVDKAEFKRRQAAPTIRVHQRAWGFGRRLPIAQNYKPIHIGE